MISSIGDALHNLHKETGSHIYAQVLLKNTGQRWQLLRGAGIIAETEVQNLYPNRTPLCQMVWHADDHDPKSLQKAHVSISKAIDKKQPTMLDLKRRSVRKVLLALIARYIPTLSSRSTIPQTALQKNNIILNGFARIAEQHWSNVESYKMQECDTFLQAHEQQKVTLEWGAGVSQTAALARVDETSRDSFIESILMAEDSVYQFGAQQTATLDKNSDTESCNASQLAHDE